MSNKHKRYHDYQLLNSNEGTDVDFDMPIRKSRRTCMCITITTFLVLAIAFFLIIFVIGPLIFMKWKSLQTNLIFTHFNLPKEQKYFETQYFPSYKNRYVTFNYTKNGGSQTLGLWHILPLNLAYEDLYVKNLTFDEALRTSNYSVLIYFHGTGEARSDNIRKYQLFHSYFHVIAFDYRSYADSSKGPLSEEAVVGDCIELYKWVRNRTNSSIYVWGHSLGAAIAAETVQILENSYNLTGSGLVLESAFTSLRDELYVHPIVKIFAWLPWFEATIVNPLKENGLIFDTATHISAITCPIMLLHAQDDNEIPCKFGRQLYKIASDRKKPSVYHEFEAKEDYRHNYIYQDPFLKLYIMKLMICIESVKSRAVVEQYFGDYTPRI